MKKVSVIKNNEVVQFVRFETQEKADTWIEMLASTKAWGNPSEYTTTITDITAQVEAEKAQIEAIKSAQAQAGLRLQTFDAQIDGCNDLTALKAAIKQMLHDISILLV